MTLIYFKNGLNKKDMKSKIPKGAKTGILMQNLPYDTKANCLIGNLYNHSNDSKLQEGKGNLIDHIESIKLIETSKHKHAFLEINPLETIKIIIAFIERKKFELFNYASEIKVIL